MGVRPWARDSASISSADFNENGFIDEEDLQKIVLRLLNSDDVSEDLLMDVTQHVCTQRPEGEAWGSRWPPKAPGHLAIFFGRDPETSLGAAATGMCSPQGPREVGT